MSAIFLEGVVPRMPRGRSRHDAVRKDETHVQPLLRVGHFYCMYSLKGDVS